MSKRTSVRAAALLGVLGVAALGCGNGGSSTPAPPAASNEKPAVTQPDCSADSTDWPMFGHNVCNTSSPLIGGGINKDNVSKLTVKWVYSAAGDISTTPAVVGGAVYVPDWGGMIDKVDAQTGKAVWTKNVAELVGSTLTGFVSRTTPVVVGDLVIIGTQRKVPDIVTSKGVGAFLIALDKNTGAVKWKTPVHEGHPAAVVTSSPVLDGTTLYVGIGSLEEGFGFLGPYNYTFRGGIIAVDATSGTILWTQHTISDDVYYGDAGADSGMTAGYAGASVWSSSPTVDRKRKQLYVTTGNNYAAPPGAPSAVPGNNVDAVMALDLASGAIKWSNSLPEGGMDVFNVSGGGGGHDSDFGCGANLFTATIGGHAKDLVGAGQKSGQYWAFDPDTGKQQWMTQVGPGGFLGGLHWGTAADGNRIYVEVNNGSGSPQMIQGMGSQAGQMSSTGTWAALDPATGHVLWQVANPAMSKPLNGSTVDGPVVAVNGVMFGGSMDKDGYMFALNADTGDVLWKFKSGGTVYGGPAVAGGVVYWGSGMPSRVGLNFGTPSKKLYAFSVPQ